MRETYKSLEKWKWEDVFFTTIDLPLDHVLQVLSQKRKNKNLKQPNLPPKINEKKKTKAKVSKERVSHSVVSDSLRPRGLSLGFSRQVY